MGRVVVVGFTRATRTRREGRTGKEISGGWVEKAGTLCFKMDVSGMDVSGLLQR